MRSLLMSLLDEDDVRSHRLYSGLKGKGPFRWTPPPVPEFRVRRVSTCLKGRLMLMCSGLARDCCLNAVGRKVDDQVLRKSDSLRN